MPLPLVDGAEAAAADQPAQPDGPEGDLPLGQPQVARLRHHRAARRILQQSDAVARRQWRRGGGGGRSVGHGRGPVLPLLGGVPEEGNKASLMVNGTSGRSSVNNRNRFCTERLKLVPVKIIRFSVFRETRNSAESAKMAEIMEIPKPNH